MRLAQVFTHIVKVCRLCDPEGIILCSGASIKVFIRCYGYCPVFYVAVLCGYPIGYR